MNGRYKISSKGITGNQVVPFFLFGMLIKEILIYEIP
jgi:hypothetical protein